MTTGTVNVNNLTDGNQTVSGGGAGAGIVNVNTNSALGTSATLWVNNTLTLGAATGALNGGSGGTVNVNGATLAANIITNGAGTATINLTNSTLVLTNLSPGNTTYANATIRNFNTGGSTNIIAVAFIAPPTGYPFTNKLVAYSGSIGGAGYDFGLVLPAASPAFAGNLVNNSANHEIDLVVTSGPVPARKLTWSGAVSSDWDVATTQNWLATNTPTTYNQLDFVTFDDTASGTTNVNLDTAVTPRFRPCEQQRQNLHVHGRSHQRADGAAQGGDGHADSGQQRGNNDFSGGVTISNGTLQLGNADFSGNLPPGAVTDYGTLAFDGSASITVSNVIQGSGSVTVPGGGTLPESPHSRAPWL